MKKYVVELSQHERESLKSLIRSGKGPARMFSHARILLKADTSEGGPSWCDEKISEAFDVTVQTVERVRKQLVLEGFDAVLKRREYTQKVSRKKVDADVEAHLVALACSETPEGYSRWSLRLLADQMVELGYIDSISHEAVRQTLKKRIEALAACASPRMRMPLLFALWKMSCRFTDRNTTRIILSSVWTRRVNNSLSKPVVRPGHPKRYDYEYRRVQPFHVFRASAGTYRSQKEGQSWTGLRKSKICSTCTIQTLARLHLSWII